MKELIAGLMMVAATAAVANELSIEELNAKHGVKGRVSFAEDAKGEPIAVLRDANGSCRVALRGAQVQSCSFAGDEHPLLYEPKTGYRAVSGARDFVHGGVPLLWPWFGSSGAPQFRSWWRRGLNALGCSFELEGPFHATARYSLFAVKNVSAEGDETSVTLVLGPCAEVSEYTPGKFELEYRITLGAHRLGLQLTTKNLGEEPFRYREGYHPYFAVSDCYAVTLSGVDGCVYESSRDLPCDVTHVWQGKVPEWPGCDLFKFKQPASVITLEDPAWKRLIVLTTTGARDVVTWCQDVRGTKGGMAMNILPEECRSYFCIEPSNFYPESEITLAQGESHTFETIITVKENAK